jgi:hypothetical protein
LQRDFYAEMCRIERPDPPGQGWRHALRADSFVEEAERTCKARTRCTESP